MSYAGFCEECGVPYYESDRLAHQHLQPQAESAPNEHAINVEVAKIARDEGWSLPDADLIEFGVKVWNKAILSQHPIRPGRTKLLMKFWSAMHMAGFAKDKEWDAQEKIHIKDLVRLLERTEIMQQESKVQGEGEELHVNEMWEISRLKAKVAELQRELSQTRLPKCSQCGSDQLSAFACSSGKKGVSARVVVSCDSCGNEAEFATFFNRVLAGAASHNGQGWEAKLRNLIAAKEPNGYPLWFNRAVRSCKDCDSEDCCDRHHAIAARDFTGCDEFVSQFMAALPAPPSEADWPQR